MLAVVEVCRAELHEEEDRQDHIHHGKDHVVDHRLHLSLGGVPCLLDSSGYVACGEGRYREGADDHHHQHGTEKNSHNFLITHCRFLLVS